MRVTWVWSVSIVLLATSLQEAVSQCRFRLGSMPIRLAIPATRRARSQVTETFLRAARAISSAVTAELLSGPRRFA